MNNVICLITYRINKSLKEIKENQKIIEDNKNDLFSSMKKEKIKKEKILKEERKKSNDKILEMMGKRKPLRNKGFKDLFDDKDNK